MRYNPHRNQDTPVNTVELNKIRKSYDEFVAVNDLSLVIRPGEVFGLLGPNGAGKTSTLRMMIGITIPDSGVVSMFGEPLRRSHMQRLGYLPEERGLYKKMKLLDQLVFLGQLKGLSSHDAQQRSMQWCERLGLKEWTGKKVEELSKGMQQKAQFVGAVIHDPQFVVMDEPFSALDPSSAVVLKDAFLDLKKAGKTLLFSTHQMNTAERLCDSICLINHGRAILEGDLGKVRAGYGKRNVQIKYEGGSQFLQDAKLVQSFNDYGNYVEVRLAPQADPQELLRAATACARLTRFELMEPSLEEIFLEAVGKANA
ncbi:MAG: ATP-binding cassette domain-containing protein [Candidatus Sulfotelmatobacter sp.]